MKNLSKILSLVLSIALVVTSITLTPAKAETIQKKQFQFAKMVATKTELTSDYYYSDSYFANSAYTYNSHLATMSMCCSCAASGNAMSDPIYIGLSKDIEDLLAANGFGSFYINEDFNKPGTKETIGFMFAKKNITVNNEDYTLIAVNFRNTHYEREWYNNFEVGEGKEHAGFKNAADKTQAALADYVRDNNIDSSIKIWINGYSRGGAVTNLLAKQLDDEGFINDKPIEAEDIYAYTFGTSNVTAKTSYNRPLYKNIFNILSKDDIVPPIPPTSWNWHRYGVDVYLPSKSDRNYASKRARAQKFLDKFSKGEKIGPNTLPGYMLNPLGGIIKTGNQDVETILNTLVTAIANSIGSTENYNKCEPAVDYILDIFYDTTDAQMNKFLNELKNKVSDPESLAVLINGGDEAVEMVCDCLNKAGIPLPDSEAKQSLKEVINYLGKAIMSDPIGTTTGGLTIAFNVIPFVSNHFNSTYLAWMQSLDSNYKLDSDNPPAPSKVTKPGKVKMKSAKRLSAKKVKVKFKKVKGAKGYQVKVYKGKKTYAKKYTKKTKITIKSKKFKKKKKLYVKVRAYKLDGKKKVFGKWSKAKKVKK